MEDINLEVIFVRSAMQLTIEKSLCYKKNVASDFDELGNEDSALCLSTSNVCEVVKIKYALIRQTNYYN